MLVHVPDDTRTFLSESDREKERDRAKGRREERKAASSRNGRRKTYRCSFRGN